MAKQSSSELIRQIILEGTPAEKRELYDFTLEDSNEKILKRFELFSRGNFPRYFPDKSAPFHKDMVLDYIRSYRGECNGVEIAFRGGAKTALLKLFMVYVLVADKDNHRKYLKVLSRDLKNAKQFVTDVYNNLLELEGVYGDMFEKEGDKKHEETMGAFDLKGGRKLTAGTVGQTQRGHLQDAFRPDWIVFEDVEDRETISSIVITEAIINRCDEAIQGLSFDGNYQVNANYISDAGTIQWFLNKPQINSRITPIIDGAGRPTWNRYSTEKIQQIKDDTDDWAGEYLCDPTRTGDKFFDITLVKAMLAKATKPDRVSGLVRHWASYDPSHRYGIGEDLSDGIGKDSCALVMFDFKLGRLIASADDNETAPDLFTHEVARLGAEFGNCIVAPETNNTCGGIAIRVLKEEQYPNIYQKELTDKVNNVISTVLGWHTNSKTKPDMLYQFRKDFNDGLIDIPDERVLKEMLAFTKLDLQDARNSAITRHFDLLISACIAWAMKDHAGSSEGVKDFYANMTGKRKVAVH